MRWRERRRSGNVEDRRGMPTRGLAVGGGLGTVVLLLLAVVMGVDPRDMVQPMPQGGDLGSSERQIRRKTNWRTSCPACWPTPRTYGGELFSAKGRRNREPKLVLFTDQVQSACGFASAAVGPFYCPGDETVYIDLQFYDQLKRQFGGTGRFCTSLCDRARNWPPRAKPTGHNGRSGCDARAAEQRPIQPIVRSAWSCKPTSLPACGHIMLSVCNTFSRRGTSTRRWKLPVQLATIACRERAKATSFQTPSRTARPHNACAGSAAGSKPATSIRETPSTPPASDFLSCSSRSM